jgi:hypothetical protein
MANLKSKEEIQELAESEYGTEIGSIRGSNPYDLEADRKNGFIKGYTKCQEDMGKELEELRESIRKNTWYDEDGNAQVNLYGINNNLLNKQD